jgi:Uma2 family endonuclease
VLSPSNTAKEMLNKRKDYFTWGVKLVWELDPVTKQMRVYSSADTCSVVDINGTLDGGSVLPGFTLPMATLFADLERGQ